ncbi:Regulator of RNase E activity RraA [Modicisalibacter ilicicola DSM 19980]|uniref:Putative 4-hydroxy-4-methyl-2-oxoglutarate aldolase n=1 Tax=Modicisalibacter ilicicola DSM 19980 TaxID=1121942 RepID=A0A1M5B2B3_9GAMM|nr:RraA family protein [Halomonas ilicicola]SHF36608.1 Regulator of RNase E activity RraA [Halomonas ilicicola DSM 19980]
MYHIAPMPAPLDEPLRQQLLGCETATIGHFREVGFIDPAIRSVLAQTRIAGTAVTLSLPHTDGTLLNHAMRLVRPGDVLVIDRQGDERHACWGGVMTQVAKGLGVAGVIIDGVATDAATIREQGFPVWSRGVAALTTKLAGIGGALNVPISVGGLVVQPGDAILADESGVLVLPPEDVAATASHAIHLQHQEEEILARVAAGELLPDISGATALVERINQSAS